MVELSEEVRQKLLKNRAGGRPRKSVEQLRDDAKQGVANARDLASQAARRAEEIESNTMLSQEGKRAETEKLTPLREQAFEAISRAGEAVERESYHRGQSAEPSEVDPAELSAKAAVLGPVLSAARENPEALLNAYQARFLDPAARRILEDTAQSLLDAFPSETAGTFQKRYERLRDELISAYAPGEREAQQDLAALAEAGDYLDSGRTAVEADFKEVMGAKLSGREKIARQRAAASVNAFEGG